MHGALLRFYVHEGQRHHGRPLWEWLLEEARHAGIGGGSAFRAMAGFGRHQVLHESRFFELAGSLTVEVEFMVSEEQADAFLARLRAEPLRLVYARVPASFGVLNPDAADPPPLAGGD